MKAVTDRRGEKMKLVALVEMPSSGLAPPLYIVRRGVRLVFINQMVISGDIIGFYTRLPMFGILSKP